MIASFILFAIGVWIGRGWANYAQAKFFEQKFPELPKIEYSFWSFFKL